MAETPFPLSSGVGRVPVPLSLRACDVLRVCLIFPKWKKLNIRSLRAYCDSRLLKLSLPGYSCTWKRSSCRHWGERKKLYSIKTLTDFRYDLEFLVLID